MVQYGDRVFGDHLFGDREVRIGREIERLRKDGFTGELLDCAEGLVRKGVLLTAYPRTGCFSFEVSNIKFTVSWSLQEEHLKLEYYWDYPRGYSTGFIAIVDGWDVLKTAHEFDKWRHYGNNDFGNPDRGVTLREYGLTGELLECAEGLYRIGVSLSAYQWTGSFSFKVSDVSFTVSWSLQEKCLQLKYQWWGGPKGYSKGFLPIVDGWDVLKTAQQFKK